MSSIGESASARPPVAGTGLVNVLGAVRTLSTLLVLLVLMAVIAAVEPRFFSPQNLSIVLVSASIIAILAASQAALIISRNVDLSIASIVGLSAFLVGLLVKDGGVALPLAIGIALLVGAGLGAINGALVAYARAPSIVVTLGTLNVYRGLVLLIAGGKGINAFDLPAEYPKLTSGDIVGIPLVVIYAVIVVAILSLGMRRLLAGRWVYAIGSNPTAARTIGLPTARVQLGIFVLSGLVAALAGVLWGSTYGTIDSGTARGLELSVIAAVVVGGVSIAGGSGTAFGAAIGALLLATLGNALTLAVVSQFWLQAIAGVLILVAVLSDAGLRRYVDRVASRATRRA